MSDAIIVALITGGLSLGGNLIASHSANKKRAVEEAVREQKLDDRLDRLEQKVEEHNSFGKKFGEASSAIVAIQKDIEWIKKEKS